MAKSGGCVITGNEDALKHTAMTIVFALNHVGYTIPPKADCGWIGKVGPGPSYGDEIEGSGRVGFDNDFTQRNATIMTWNCMHLAWMLKESNGISNEGNDRTAWNAGKDSATKIQVEMRYNKLLQVRFDPLPIVAFEKIVIVSNAAEFWRQAYSI